MRTAFIETLCEVAEGNERIWLLTGDLGFSVLERFSARFPERYVNVGVAEQNLAGVAAGLARCGKIPFIYSIANFPTLRCLEQIRNDVCYHEADVKVVAVGSGFTYGAQGYTHYGVEEMGIMRILPNMTVVSPADPVEARLATRAVAERPGPCYLRLGKAGEPVVHEQIPDFQLGRAIVVRPGRDATLISTGGMLTEALETSTRLAAKGIDVRVLSMHTVKPLDNAAVIQAARETAAIVTVEEHSITGGLGSAVAEVLAEAGVPTRFRRFGMPDQLYHTVGSQNHMRRLAGDLCDTVVSLLDR
ncbi:MAG TPA: transketolase C-terminal domain-containing protein [Isosphaeraceae bacterium]|jgi:transketolase|nr:transketolase C-terminal domain-containing protein [Isosphaeraceae bacterium]